MQKETKDNALKPSRFTHHMLKEILEEPTVVKNTLEKNQRAVEKIVDEIHNRKYGRIYITGSGTSYHAGLAYQYVSFNLGMAMTSLIPASEFQLWIPSIFDSKTLVVAISQSGENADILNALHVSLNKGLDVLAVTNTKDSTLANKATYTLLTYAGEELAVTATKSYIAQLAILFLFSLELAAKQGRSGELMLCKKKLFETPKVIEKILKLSNDTVLKISEKYSDKNFFFILGSGASYVTALETALKLKESCNIYAEGFASREFLHGPIQLLNDKTPVIFILSSDEVENLMSLINSVRRFGAPVISVSDDEEKIKFFSTDVVYVPKNFPKMFSPIIYMPP
ncbi:MAG: SIS domain-containing protein, partial [Candidatus Bathyarchaeia archaeon]